MAEQSGGWRVTEEVVEELMSLADPDMDLESFQLVLSCVARSMAGGCADHQGRQGEDGKTQAAALFQEYAELLALIRDSGIDRAQLDAILRLNPQTRPTGDGNPHPPVQ
jgi:hypothetical protein